VIFDNGCCDDDEVALLIERAMAGAEPSMPFDLRTVADLEIRLRGRVTRCGPPPAALLVLSPRAARATSALNARSAR
jgi:hypothetical protein